MPKKKSNIPKKQKSTDYRNLLRLREEELQSLRLEPENLTEIKEHLLELVILETKQKKSPLDCIQAFLSSATARVPAPLWAADQFWSILKDRMMGKIKSLDKVLELEKPHRARRDERLMLDVWRLRQLGYPLDEACQLVAKRLLLTPDWNQTGFNISFQTKDVDDYERLAATLRTMYYRDGWNKTLNNLDNDTKAKVSKKLDQDRNTFLSQFPSIKTDP